MITAQDQAGADQGPACPSAVPERWSWGEAGGMLNPAALCAEAVCWCHHPSQPCTGVMLWEKVQRPGKVCNTCPNILCAPRKLQLHKHLRSCSSSMPPPPCYSPMAALAPRCTLYHDWYLLAHTNCHGESMLNVMSVSCLSAGPQT